MLINLVPEFLAVLESSDPEAAYRRYREAHRAVLDAYWRNYVFDPDSPQADEVVRAQLGARRTDLHALIASRDAGQIVDEALRRAEEALGAEQPVDCYLMIGMGAANAGELVLGGRGVVFVCLEHFTGRANPETWGMGLGPDLLPLWVAHEVAHAVRYTSSTSRSELRRLVAENAGYYDFWLTGSRATLRELLLNEGLAVHAAERVAPGFDPADYFGYSRRQYARLREMESFLTRAVEPELDLAGLGLRLRYLTGGTSPSSRLVNGRLIPERAGYYLGHRMAEALVRERGIAAALRSAPEEFATADRVAGGVRSA